MFNYESIILSQNNKKKTFLSIYHLSEVKLTTHTQRKKGVTLLNDSKTGTISRFK
ncbi:3639_t:CDS:1, partial [Cetraspora pellucida]